MIRFVTIAFMFVLAAVTVALPSEVIIRDVEILTEEESGVKIDPADQEGITVVNIDDLDLIEADRVPEEKAIYAIQKCEVGYARTTNVGITVQKGTSGTIHFHISLKAVTVETLESLSKQFEKTLTKSEKKPYHKMKKHFDGGLDVPWLKWIGIDLDKKVTKKDMDHAFSNQVNYNEKALVARKLLKDVKTQKIVVKGTLTATGVSFIPLTVFSFIKLSKVYFENGETMIVISKHPGNAVAATNAGRTVPSSNEAINIF